ncbi:MAG: tRNA epoxyqueuosine(34) reductase QueG [Deltaproteobacteria bacterium]|nr:tRNA epoxyqueuosine(34) reductase QueG [Deltaproteobacteria bacterium]
MAARYARGRAPAWLLEMLTSEIKEKARQLGFELVGIAAADDPALIDAVARYSDWVARGYGATMDYLRRHTELKAQPEKLLPGWKSVVCVGLLYGAGSSESQKAENGAEVSLYTRGADYHEVVGTRLVEFAEWLQARGVTSRPFVDSEPVLDRFWASRAGLGWIGRNAMLINRKAGSYFFIGGLLLNVALDADEPGIDHCGRCRKCIEACPTVAITEDRFIESGKCIAYHTIENRGVVPESVMAATGSWIAGCDICQRVCPWNDPVTPGPAFETKNPAFNAELTALARWSAGDFKANTAGIAMGRMKFSGFVRNVAIALANSAVPAAAKSAALDQLEVSVSALPVGAGREGALAALEWAKRKK